MTLYGNIQQMNYSSDTSYDLDTQPAKSVGAQRVFVKALAYLFHGHFRNSFIAHPKGMPTEDGDVK